MNRNALLPAACARTGTACRCSSARRTAWRCCRRRLRQPEILPRHRLGAARATPRSGLRLRRLLHGAGTHALELYAEAFEAAGALDRLEAFASFHGADFYGLPRNTTCESFAKMDSEPPEGMGELMGTFRVKKGELVFVKEAKDESSADE
jgi:hypothetical protein